MLRRLAEMLFPRIPSDDERHRKAREVEDLTVNSEATLERAKQALKTDRLDAYRRIRVGR